MLAVLFIGDMLAVPFIELPGAPVAVELPTGAEVAVTFPVAPG